MRSAVLALAVWRGLAGTCCWSKWGDASSCGNYPAGGSGPICGNDGVTVCQSNSDCDNPAPPTPAPTPAPTPTPSPTPPTPSPTPPAPTPPPTPPTPGPLPDKVVGLYLLVADDDWPYKSETEWVPKIPDYLGNGPNVLWLAFLHPAKMPALPPAMQYIGMHRPDPNQKIIVSVGGQSYSDSAQWPWLGSDEAAEAMAAEVVQWKAKYGIDGIDLDIEGNQPGPTAWTFAKKVKELDPEFIVTQPVFGSPQVKEENYMVNQNYAPGVTSSVDKIGIMVYQGTGSLQYVDNYVHGSQQWQGFPIHVDVPSQSVMLGAGGQASASTILALANAAQKQNLGGIMVWYASVIDSATGKVGNQYSGGSMDASIQSDVTQATWKQALDIMNGKATLAISV